MMFLVLLQKDVITKEILGCLELSRSYSKNNSQSRVCSIWISSVVLFNLSTGHTWDMGLRGEWPGKHIPQTQVILCQIQPHNYCTIGMPIEGLGLNVWVIYVNHGSNGSDSWDIQQQQQWLLPLLLQQQQQQYIQQIISVSK